MKEKKNRYLSNIMAKKDKDEMAAQGMPQTMEDYLLSQLEEQVVLKV